MTEARAPLTHHFSQKALQQTIEFAEAFCLPFLTNELLPATPFNYKGMVDMCAVPISSILLRTLRHVSTQENPLDFLRNQGHGKIVQGLLKIVSTELATLGILAAVGYTGTAQTLKHLPELLQSENRAVQLLAKILLVEVYRMTVTGAASYLFYRSMTQLGRKIWSLFIPSDPEVLKDQPQVNFALASGNYIRRWLSDVAGTETLLYYLNVNSQTWLTPEPHFQINTVIGFNLLARISEFVAYTPNLIETMPCYAPDVELGKIESCLTKPQTQSMANQTALWVFMALCAYVITEIAITVTGVAQPTDDDFTSQRLRRFGMAWGTVQLLEYLFKEITPYARNNISFFKRAADEELTTLLSDDDMEPVNHVSPGMQMDI